MTSRTFLGVLAFSSLASVAFGCGGGGTATGGSGNGGGTSSSSSGSSSSGAASSSSGTSTSSSSGTGGSTSSSSSSSGVSCSDFAKPPPTGTPLTVRLVNKTTNNVYLGDTMASCLASLGFTLEDASMNMLKPSRQNCEFTCAELQQGTCACPPGCAAPIVTLLAPGAHYDIGWPGTVFVSEDMPATCYQEQTCASGGCFVEQAPPAGTLTMRASAWSMAVCPGSPNQTCVDCVPGFSGSCIVQQAQTVGGTEIKGSVQWSMGQGLAEIDFM